MTLQDRTRPRLVVQTGHTDVVWAAKFSPDSNYALTASWDGTAKFWEVKSGKQLITFLANDAIDSADFAPDGQSVLLGSRKDLAQIGFDTSKQDRNYGESGFLIRYGACYSPPSGKYVLMTGHDGLVRVYETKTGTLVYEVQTGKSQHSQEGHQAAWAPDADRFVTACDDRSMRCFSLQKRSQQWEVSSHPENIFALAVTKNAQQQEIVASACHDGVTRFFRLDDGSQTGEFSASGDHTFAVAFSPDGSAAISGGAKGKVHVLNPETANAERQFAPCECRINSLSYDRSGKLVIAGTHESGAVIWDAQTGEILQRLRGYVDSVQSVDFSGDGERFVVTTTWRQHQARVWSLAEGMPASPLDEHDGDVYAQFSHSGEQLLTGDSAGILRRWQAETGELLQQFQAHQARIMAVAWSHADRRIASGSWDKTAAVFDAEDGAPQGRFGGDSGFIFSLAFSPDGQSLLTGERIDEHYDKNAARQWRLQDGSEIRRFENNPSQVSALALSPDGELLLTVSHGEARLWSVSTGALQKSLRVSGSFLGAGALSPDGRFAATGGSDRNIALFATDSGEYIRDFPGHHSSIHSLAFSPNGEFLLSGSQDGTTRLWRVASGEELAKMVSFRDGSWAVIDHEGRYDASNGGDITGLHWVADREPIALEQLKSQYYEPGLLAKLTGHNSEPLRDVSHLAEEGITFYPEVAIQRHPTADNPVLKFYVCDRGGGIGPVAVFINNKEVTPDARPADLKPDARDFVVTMDLSSSPLFLPEGPNSISIEASNADGTLKNREEHSARGFGTVDPKKAAKSAEPPSIYAIVCGVSDYRGTKMDLRFASKDANSFAAALALAGKELFENRIHVQTLTDETTPATKENLLEAFKRTRKAKAGDILVVYLAGHGVAHGGDAGDFYYLLKDAESGELRDSTLRSKTAISSQELTEQIKQTAALKQILILDTCHSGRLIQRLSGKRAAPSSHTRSLDRMKDRTGMFILAGSAADAVSYESTRYGQGLLTYTLLLGMKGAALREKKFVDVGTWFSYAIDQVPVLAQGIGGIQQPRLAIPRGGESFDVGELSPAAREKIHISKARPILVRASLQEDGNFRDHLGLTQSLNTSLRLAASRADNPPFVFIDTARFPKSHEIHGRYSVKNGSIRLRAILFDGGKKLTQFETAGKVENMDALCAILVAKVEKAIRAAT